MNVGALLALLAGVLGLLLAWAASVVLRSGSGKLLRDRALAAGGLDGAHSVVKASPSIRIATAGERSLPQRLVEALGYNRELPPAYTASIPVVAGIAVAAGLLVFWRVRVLFGDLGGIAGGFAIAAAVARFLFRRKTKLYQKLLFSQIPDAISLVLRAVRAGLPVGEAVRNVSREVPSPSRDEFARVAGEMALGIPIETAIWNLYSRSKIREYAFFAVTLGMQGQTGGNLGETLENLADTVRRRVAMVAKARALAAEARMSAGILTALPFLTAGAILVLSPDYVTPLFTDKRGPNFLVAFAVLLTAGTLTIRWLIQKATQD
jgi:tight adherence protein B